MLAKGSIQISTGKTESHNMVNGFLKGAKASQQRRYSFFQQMVLKKLDTHMLKKKMNRFTPHTTKINSNELQA